jgi:hypothetical protein
MTYVDSILRVLVVGLILGAGLPAVFAGALVAYSYGAGGEEADGVVHQPHPALKYLGILVFAVVAFVVIVAVAWIARTTIIHHFGVDLFPFLQK